MIYAFGNCELHSELYTLMRAGQQIHLRPKVYRTLAYLIENRHRVVSKDELCNAVWDGRYVSNTTIESTVKAVRRAAGDSGKDQCVIKTLTQHGYRFVAPIESISGTPEEPPNSQATRPATDQTSEIEDQQDTVAHVDVVNAQPKRSKRQLKDAFLDVSLSTQIGVFFEVHRKLPRGGPGNQKATERAFKLTKLPDSPRILDIGCGHGMQTVDLAELAPRAHIQAIDSHPGYVQEVRQRVFEKGYDDRVTISAGDMASLPYEQKSFDLVWSEGAAYIMGVEKALTQWGKLLKPNGFLAFTDLVWLRSDPPEEIRAYWANAYPDLKSLESRRTLAQRCGYEVIGDFILPEEAWWDNFYSPMQARVLKLRAKYEKNPAAMMVLDSCVDEIENYRRYSAFYGYAFLVLKLA